MRISDWSSDVCSSDLTPSHRDHLTDTRRATVKSCKKKSLSASVQAAPIQSGRNHAAPAPPPRSRASSHSIVSARRRCAAPGSRSEEHTSELQSLMRTSYAVFCLKTKTHTKYDTQQTEK